MSVKRVFFKELKLSIDGTILGIYGTIGRHSGICKVRFANGSEKIVSLWDRWCHFERNHFNFAIPRYYGKVGIEVLQEDFDTRACKVPVNFKKYKKQIVCREIYWQGERLVVENESEGAILPLWKIEVIRQLRELKHFVGKWIKIFLIIENDIFAF